MKKIKPALEHFWYQDLTFRVANTARTILRALLLVIGIAITATVFVGGHVVKAFASNQH